MIEDTFNVFNFVRTPKSLLNKLYFENNASIIIAW